MALFTYNTASDYAKDTWLPTFIYQLAAPESLLGLFGWTTDHDYRVEGRRAFKKVKIGDDLGFTVLNQGGNYGQPGDITAIEGTLELMRFADTISFDAHEFALLDSIDAGASPKIWKEKSQSAMNRVRRELERMAIMDGTGILAKHAADSALTITLDVAGTDYSERNPYTWIDDALRSRYTLVNPTTGADVVQGFTVTASNETTNVLTTSATQTAGTAGDVIVTDYGASAWTSGGVFTSREMEGLLAIIDSAGTYQNINRATFPQWGATEINGGGTLRNINESLVHELTNKTGRRAREGMLVPNKYCALASPGTWTSYHNLISPGLRYTVSENPDIGWGGREMIPMNGVPLYKHSHAPRNMILLARKDGIKFFGPKHDKSEVFSFDEHAGSVFFKRNATSGQGHADGVNAYITGWLGMDAERPRDHGKLDDLIETAGAY